MSDPDSSAAMPVMPTRADEGARSLQTDMVEQSWLKDSMHVNPAEEELKTRFAGQPAYIMPYISSTFYKKMQDKPTTCGQLAHQEQMDMQDHSSNAVTRSLINSFGKQKEDRFEVRKVDLPKTQSAVWKPDWIPVTTLMIRNVPCTFEIQDLVHVIEEAGFKDCYDFLYLPMRNEKPNNKGYALLNLHSQVLADKFKSCFHKKTFPKCMGEDFQKPLNISAACVQGFTKSTYLAQKTESVRGLYVAL